jgi:GxxExxY protein
LSESFKSQLLHAELTHRVIGTFYWVYDALGFGFLESVYCNALAHEFTKRGIGFEREVVIDVWYDTVHAGHFRADFLVEGVLIVEVKAGQAITEVDRKQLMNYLRGTTNELGLLLHFGPKPIVQRVIYTNDRKPMTASARTNRDTDGPTLRTP